jgi:hypothetical protein
MNVLARAAVLAALLGAGAAASAATFQFSYTFGDGQQVTGDFEGTTTDGGQSVTNVQNIQVQLNGIPFAPVVVGGVTLGNSTLQANTWNPSTASFSDTIPVTVYANGALNNFIFSDVDAATNTSPDYEFAYINDPTNGIFEVVAANFLQSDSFSKAEGNATQEALDTPGNAAKWTLTEVQPPTDGPIPFWALGALGVGLVGIASRRTSKTAESARRGQP